MFVPNHDFFQLDYVGMRVMHLAKLTEDRNLSEGCDRETIAFLSHFDLLEGVLLTGLLVLGKEDDAVSACTDLLHLCKVCHTARIPQQ